MLGEDAGRKEGREKIRSTPACGGAVRPGGFFMQIDHRLCKTDRLCKTMQGKGCTFCEIVNRCQSDTASINFGKKSGGKRRHGHGPVHGKKSINKTENSAEAPSFCCVVFT